MAKLFKDKAIKKNLEKFEIQNFEEKIDIVKKWLIAYRNKTLHQKTETQCEQAFNQSFFVELLGYTTFPNPIYTIDPKTTTEAGGQKPDAALGYFGTKERRVIAVVEVKDVNTPLDKSQKREGNLSPIQQAFKYKPQFKECNFVIASNFFEIRLFRDNQLDYEVFTLETLADPKNDYFELRKFYYLLCAENFVLATGKTVTERLLSEIRVEQEQITKAFYSEYKSLRYDLIKNILKNNTKVAEGHFDLMIEKAQKIIDRVVFTCFCEDLDLLPEGKLQEVVMHTEKMGITVPIWDILKGFFRAIDHGSDKLGIPDGYNGELFKEDAELDNLKVDDEICKKFVDLGKYDFTEDLSVNILGHIFEQSISDLEEIKMGTEVFDKKKSKRKKEGIFYTPDHIVDYIVKNSLGRYLEEKEQEIKDKYGLKEEINDDNYRKRALKVYEEYQQALWDVKVLDPACGSGAFLVKVFDYLLSENIRVADTLASLGRTNIFSDKQLIKDLLEKNIYGVDLNPESVEITKLSLWLKTAQKGKKLVGLKNNIKCGNSLIEDSSVAGDKAFSWAKEFHEIIDNGGFDVVVGNPPYVSVRKLAIKDKNYFEDNYQTAKDQYDLYVLFIEKALELLKISSYMAFITPNKFLIAKYGFHVRKYIYEHSNLVDFIDHSKESIFVDASVYPVVFILKKLRELRQKKDAHDKYDLLDIFSFKKQNSIIEKMDSCHDRLGGICLIKEAIHTGNIRNKLILSAKRNENCHKLLRGKDCNRYELHWQNFWIDYSILPDKTKNEYATLIDKDYFEGEKIFLREIALRPSAVYDDQGYYALNKVYVLKIKNGKKINLKYLLALINSSLFAYYFEKQFGDIRVSGGYLQFKKQFTDQLPIIIPDISQQLKLVDRADNLQKMYSEKYDKAWDFIHIIQNEFSINKITEKLEDFYKLNFDEFIKELKIKDLSLDKKIELLHFFERYKKEILKIKSQIDSADIEMDDIIFDLYGLNNEEKKIILDRKNEF